MLKHVPWRPLAATLLTGALLAACGGPQQTGPTTAPTAADAGALKSPGTIPTQAPAAKTAASPAPGAASPVAKTAASPAPAGASPVAKTAASPVTAAPSGPPRGAPAGQMTYLWHTAISPAWFDPQENPQQLTPYGWQYMMHDAVVKHLPGRPLSPSLAESYEIAPDFRSATFRLRPNLKFHNGDPLTSEDVKWTYENYRGANANVLKSKTERIETPDAQTVRFVFKEPFLDFLILYGSPASGAGWVVPSKYYQQVGPNGFKQNPIGAGPYRMVRQTAGSEVVLEAFPDYWRGAPYVKDFTVRAIAEDATRAAAFQSGEGDFVNLIPGALVETLRTNPQLQIVPVKASAIWLQFAQFNKEGNPFANAKVREAVNLALDRQAISAAEEAGLSPMEGNWIPEDWPGAIQRPSARQDQARARQLLAEAGFPNGFDVPEGLAPLPPYFSLGERVITQLREIGIRTQLVQMERGAFLAKQTEGQGAFGTGIVLQISAAPGDAAARLRSFAMCNGSSSQTCDPRIDDLMTRYDASADPAERTRLLTEVQTYILDNNIYVPIYRQAFINGVGPRIANTPEIMGTVPQYAYPGPYEDIRLK